MSTIPVSDNNALLTLALIEARRSADPKDRDRLGLFIPLVEEALLEFSGALFSEDDICKRVKAKFGLELPRHVMKTLLNRCKKTGVLEKS